jgi:hypothetical protein
VHINPYKSFSNAFMLSDVDRECAAIPEEPHLALFAKTSRKG